MSRYCPDPISRILEAAERWKHRCMVEQRSLFDEELIWTPDAFEGLRQHFVNLPDVGTGNFFQKLKEQLADAPHASKRLAIELAWLLYLFPKGSMGPDRKRENLRLIAEISSFALPSDHWALARDVLAGVGSTGTFYNTGIWVEFSFAILFLQQMAEQSREQRDALLQPDADLAGWLDGLSLPVKLPAGVPLSAGNRQFRHIFLFLMQPDRYERISSSANKRQILKSIAPKLGLVPSLNTTREIDDQLLEVRRRLSQQLEREDIDFYREPLHAMWTESSAPKQQPAVAEPSATYVVDVTAPPLRHWLVGAYWENREQRDLTAEFVSSGSWENGYRDRFLETVKAVRVGDPIAIKGTYVQKDGLPFDNQGKSVSCMRIKARGKVTRNPGDGRSLEVQWESDFKPFVVYHYTYRRTIVAIDEAKFPEVVRWIFGGEAQPLGMPADLSVVEEPDDRDDGDDTELRDTYGPAPRNVIFYGPPGTGKTRMLLERVLPAYTDDPEQETESEWLSRLVSEMGWFEVVGAAVRELAKPTASVPQIHEHRFVQAKVRQSSSLTNLSARMWSVLQSHTVQSSTTVRYATRAEPLVFQKNDTAGWSLVQDWEKLAPELAEVVSRLDRPRNEAMRANRRYEMVIFHPSYSYEDFVEGLRPALSEHEGREPSVEIQPVDGALKRICDRARRDPDRRYALVIDEINRGNIAKIFGELITLIEPDKRTRYGVEGQIAGGVQVRLPYSAEPFGVPENVDFYGTMNTADRSIALVDIALRRRFIFRQVPPQPNVILGAGGDGLIDSDDDGNPIDLRRLLQVINARLTILRGRDACVGHSYLTKVTDIAGLRAVFRDRILPLLQEHFFEDWAQIARVLSVPRGTPGFLTQRQPKIDSLFANTVDLGDLTDRPIWALSAELPAQSFRALYESVPPELLDLA